MAAAMNELLLNLQSADRGVRQHAETLYDAMLKEQRDQVRNHGTGSRKYALAPL